MGKKRTNWNRARNMDVDAWWERQVQKRLEETLAQREQAFIREHGADTVQELQLLVLRKARELGRMPHPLELEGGEYLRERLGDWAALAGAWATTPWARSGSSSSWDS